MLENASKYRMGSGILRDILAKKKKLSLPLSPFNSYRFRFMHYQFLCFYSSEIEFGPPPKAASSHGLALSRSKYNLISVLLFEVSKRPQIQRGGS
jgi:hypothetical protein